MSGQGGHKHRKVRRDQKRKQRVAKARADVGRARAIFEAKGQGWDPLGNPAQLAAMNHAGRRLVHKRARISK